MLYRGGRSSALRARSGISNWIQGRGRSRWPGSIRQQSRSTRSAEGAPPSIRCPDVAPLADTPFPRAPHARHLTHHRPLRRQAPSTGVTPRPTSILAVVTLSIAACDCNQPPSIPLTSATLLPDPRCHFPSPPSSLARNSKHQISPLAPSASTLCFALRVLSTARVPHLSPFYSDLSPGCHASTAPKTSLNRLSARFAHFSSFILFEEGYVVALLASAQLDFAFQTAPRAVFAIPLIPPSVKHAAYRERCVSRVVLPFAPENRRVGVTSVCDRPAFCLPRELHIPSPPFPPLFQTLLLYRTPPPIFHFSLHGCEGLPALCSERDSVISTSK